MKVIFFISLVIIISFLGFIGGFYFYKLKPKPYQIPFGYNRIIIESYDPVAQEHTLSYGYIQIESREVAFKPEPIIKAK